MLNTNKFWRNLLGQFAEVLIAKQVDYSGTGASTVTDLKSFVASAADGEFAFFNADTDVLIPQVAPTTMTATLFVYAAVKRDGAVERTLKFRLQDYVAKRIVYAAPVKQLSKATFAGTPVVGNYYAVKLIETTPGYQPFPRWEYGVTAATGDTVTTIMTKIAALINDPLSVANYTTDPVVDTASNAAGVLSVTAKVAGASFKIAFSPNAITDLAAIAAYTGGGTANPTYGNGTTAQIAELEFESSVYKGVTTQYPAAGNAPGDFGSPTSAATAGVQFNIYILTGRKLENSPTPVEVHHQPHTMIFCITANGAAKAEEEVKGALGL